MVTNVNGVQQVKQHKSEDAIGRLVLRGAARTRLVHSGDAYDDNVYWGLVQYSMFTPPYAVKRIVRSARGAQPYACALDGTILHCTSSGAEHHGPYYSSLPHNHNRE